MARDYGVVPATLVDDARLARCGLVAGLLYTLGKAVCDQYGRLPGDAETLTGKVLRTYAFQGIISQADVQAARDALVRERLWHRYTAGGREYIEYEGHDAEQQPSIMYRRSVRGTYPDPPDRPDMWARNRPHYAGRQGKEPETTVTEQDPHGSADLPAEPPAPTGVPSPVAVTPEVPSSDEREEFMREGVRQLARAQEQHSGSTLGPADHQKLKAAVEDAWDAQVPWQSLLTIMRTKQGEYQPTRTSPKIKSVGYYQAGWDAHIRAAREERKQASPPVTGRPAAVPDWMRPRSTDDVAEAG